MWDDPQSITKRMGSQLKKRYWDFIDSSGTEVRTLSTLTTGFLEIKSCFNFDSCMDNVEPPQARALYIQFRTGVLPLNAMKSNWKNVSVTSLCPLCKASPETIEHFIFFCPFYANLRKTWIIPTCRVLSFPRPTDALRVFRSDTTRWSVFTLSRYLLYAWWKRSKPGISP